MLSTGESIEYLVRNFPTLKEELFSNTGLFTLQISTFSRHTQRYIDNMDKKNTAYCFKIANDLLRNGNAEVKNAMAVCFCEDLNFNDGKKIRSWAKEIMPANLLQTFNNVHNYLDILFSK